MTRTIIINDGKTVLDAEVSKLSPIGFECEVPVGIFSDLIDERGRYRVFQFALFFSDRSDEANLVGDLSVSAMRRLSQTRGVLAVRFLNLNAEAASVINSFINTGTVVSLKKARQKRRA